MRPFRIATLSSQRHLAILALLAGFTQPFPAELLGQDTAGNPPPQAESTQLKLALSCASPAPTQTNGERAVQEEYAESVLVDLVGQTIVSPCKDPKTTPESCKAIAKDLTALVAEAKVASALLSACAYSHKADGTAISASDAAWYTGRAALWGKIGMAQKLNTDAFTSGTYVMPGKLKDELSLPFALNYADPVGTGGDVAISRIIAGVDVSAASSTDPAAKFLLDASIDAPLPLSGSRPIDARSWLWGFVRMSSIAQPGAVSGLSDITTYVSGLTASTPNNIVQSFEATLGYEYRFHSFDARKDPGNANSDSGRTPILLSFILDGGIITPLSDAQSGTPTVYVATPALQAFYINLGTPPANTTNLTNAANITAACITGSPSMCYVAQYPEGRDHFFRNYSGGLRLKRYYYNDDNKAYIFPTIVDFTVGQNEYVTGGQFHRAVAHFGGSTPVGSLFPGLYVYASFDLELSKSNILDQQFALQTAGSSITPASPNVAAVYVAQPDRDRYRFGAAYDLQTLFKLFSKPAKANQ